MAYTTSESGSQYPATHTHTVTLTDLDGLIARVAALESAIALKALASDLVTTNATATAAAAAIVTANAKRERDIKAVNRRTTAIVNKYLLPTKEGGQ